MNAGVTIGYNMQSDNIVYGIEGDISWADMSGAAGFTAGFCGAGNCVSEINWFGTIRGRVGVIQDNWLLYATAGVAFTNLYAGINVGGPTPSDDTETQTNAVVGGGVEMAIDGEWSAKVEGLYVFGDDFVYDVNSGCGVGNRCYIQDTDYTVIRFGVNKKI